LASAWLWVFFGLDEVSSIISILIR
jgi:hypothetical protein